MSGLLSRLIVAVASPEDATATARAIGPHRDEVSNATLLHVIEKAGGAPDKASVEQREERATEAFEAFRGVLPELAVETDVVYATSVADGILDAARERDASAIVFTSRGGGWLVKILTGDVSESLLRKSEFPVVALPDPDGGSGS